MKHSAIIAAAALICAAATSVAFADESSTKMQNDLDKNAGAAAGTSTGEQGKTSDRTPGNTNPDRVDGSTKSGAPGTAAGQTQEGTSDRTPGNNKQ